jgi:hypothetical protein
MRCICMRLMLINLAITGVCSNGFAQQVLTWDQVQQRFLAENPTLQAGQLTIDEAKANEVTAGLRPNPQRSFSTDQ